MERLKAFFKVFIDAGEQVEICLEDDDWDLFADSFATGKKLFPLIAILQDGGFPNFALLKEDANRNEMVNFIKVELNLADDKIEEVIEKFISWGDKLADTIYEGIDLFKLLTNKPA